jgi:hypothetical protein
LWNEGDALLTAFSAGDGEATIQMSILLKAADADTGKTLGTAECDVTPDAKVVSLESTVATVATSE